MNPILAQTNLSPLTTAINGVLGQVLTMFQTIAPEIFGISILCLGLMWQAQAIPGLKTWKEENPKAASALMLGALIMMCASAISHNITIS